MLEMNILKEMEKDYIDLRHFLHQNPELGFETEQIGELVAKKLKSWGYDVHKGLAKTGVVGTLKVGTSDKIIALRADMDALPIIEATKKAWSSGITGKFHGCGHDGHTTMLLAAAEYLAKTKNFNGTLRVIFQPAEELLYGGKVMIEDGLFEMFPCDIIFGLHNMPTLNENEFYMTQGVFMASCDTIHIEVFGVGAHGAMPELSIDATLVAAQITVALQSIVSRNIAPQDAVAITVGSIKSGEASNVVNDYALLKLSIRTLDKNVREKVLNRIETLVKAQAESFGATAKYTVINTCPTLVNGKEATEIATYIAKKVVGESKVYENVKPVMGSEDFAFMLEAIPNGSYIFLGAGKGYPVHHPQYDFNDNIILTGVKYWCELTEYYLKK